MKTFVIKSRISDSEVVFFMGNRIAPMVPKELPILFRSLNWFETNWRCSIKCNVFGTKVTFVVI